MRVTFQRSELTRVIPSLAKRVSSRYSPMLSMLKFDCSADGTASATGGDGELWLTRQIAGAQTIEDISFAIKPEDLSVALSKPKWETVSIEIDFKKELGTVRYGDKGSLVCTVQPTEDYPLPPDLESSIQFEVCSDIFESMAAFTLPARAINETLKPALNGLCFQVSGNQIEMFSTDTSRLHVCRHTWGGDNFRVVLAPGFAQAISSLSDGETFQIKIGGGSNYISASRGGDTLCGGLIATTYPPIGKLIPPAFDHVVTVSREEFEDALGRALMRRPNADKVYLTITDSAVKIFCRTENGAPFRESIDCISDCSSGFTFTLSGKFVMIACGALDGDALRFETKLEPRLMSGKVKMSNPDDASKFAIVATMAVEEGFEG